MKKLKFSKDFVHGNKHVDKRGSIRLVTDRFATWAEENKIGTVVEGKEDKQAAARETK